MLNPPGLSGEPLGGAAVSAAPTKLQLVHYCSVGALETSAPPVDTKTRSPKSFDSEDLK